MIALPRLFPTKARTFFALLCVTLIPCYFAGAATLFGAEAQQPFAAFKADVDIDIEDGELEIIVSLTLGAGSNGIDPPAEIVSLQLAGDTGAFSLTIPSGPLKKDRSGRFAFQATINRVRLQASIRPLGAAPSSSRRKGTAPA